MTTIDVVIPVYKPGPRFRSTIEGLANQQLDPEFNCNIIVVDDGGHDELLSRLVSEYKYIHLLTLPKNRGRAQARNAGAYYGTGEYILFIDADCEAGGSNLINRHCRVFDSGFDVSFGCIKPKMQPGEFWTGYLSAVEKRRHKAASNGDFLALTSAHFAIRRDVFANAGGFDINFRHYGFEDRDLIATLIRQNAKMHYSPDLAVLHDVDLSLTEICRKMSEAGQHTAGLFAEKHPDIYANMAFSYFDFRRHPLALKIPLLFFVPMVSALAHRIDKMLLKPWLPKAIAHLIVKSFSALAFLQGTAKA